MINIFWLFIDFLLHPFTTEKPPAPRWCYIPNPKRVGDSWELYRDEKQDYGSHKDYWHYPNSRPNIQWKVSKSVPAEILESVRRDVANAQRLIPPRAITWEPSPVPFDVVIQDEEFVRRYYKFTCFGCKRQLVMHRESTHFVWECPGGAGTEHSRVRVALWSIP